MLTDRQHRSGHDEHLVFLCPATCHCAACIRAISLASMHLTTSSSTMLIALPPAFTSISIVYYACAHCSQVTSHVHLNTVTAVVPLMGLRPLRCSTHNQTRWLLPQPTMLLLNSGPHSGAHEASELRATCEYGERLCNMHSNPFYIISLHLEPGFGSRPNPNRTRTLDFLTEPNRTRTV